MGVMGESSDGTPPRGSGSTEALPGIRNTRANRRWSQRKGSLVSSLPGSGVVRGRWSWEEGSQEQKNERKLLRSNYVIVAKAFPFQFTNSFGCANKAGAPLCAIQINVLLKVIQSHFKRKHKMFARKYSQAIAKNTSEGIEFEEKCCYHVSYKQSSFNNTALQVAVARSYECLAPQSL